MRINGILVKLAIMIAFLMPARGHAQKITDTIFYNGSWQICEKPIAVYYRIGTLNIDSFWYYTGKIKDYDMKGYFSPKQNIMKKDIETAHSNFFIPMES